MKKLLEIFLLFLASFLLHACTRTNQTGPEQDTGSLTGKLIIFHAGSLSKPVKEICDTFMKIHPGVNILTEAAGSKDCARKISELDRPCDIFLSSDFKVIEDLLMPDYALWNIRFATNEMVLAYTDKSAFRDEIDTANWIDILLKQEVSYGRSDPASDPCGVRAAMVLKLADIHFGTPGRAQKILAKDQRFIRPKETDLLALLETYSVDYIFIYRSVAMQHQLPFLKLQPGVNLGDMKLSELYAKVNVLTPGKKPGTTITETAAPMVYGLTIPVTAPSKSLAVSFLEFFLDPEGGMKIMEANGQPSVVPSVATAYDSIPAPLKKYALEP